VALHDALDGGEPYARPLKVLRGVQTLEGSEELARVGSLEAHPVVAHVVGEAPVPGVGAELYPRLGFLLGELKGVAEQVFQSHPQEPRVAADYEAVGDHELHPAVGLRLLDLHDNLAGQSA
jgi:hypothetical protein